MMQKLNIKCNCQCSTPVSLLLNCLLSLSLAFTTIVLRLTAQHKDAFTDTRHAATRQKFFAPCLFYFTVHRSRETCEILLHFLHNNFSRVIACPADAYR